MDVTRVVVANSSRARLFALGQQNQLGELQLEACLQQALDRSGVG